MNADTITVVDSTDAKHIASRKFLDTGIDAVVYRIAQGQLIYQQTDGTFKDARGGRFHLVDAGATAP